MRLKHMTEDKWNARGQGRREQRTHQPTGGRGNEGGLRIGEMERDAIIGHGMSMFTRESLMKRGDGETFLVCNGCGTIPIYNEAEDFYVCPLCDGPVEFSGKTVNTLELIPPNKRSLATFSKVEMPYVVKLLEQELSTYTNIGMRFITSKNLTRLPKPDTSLLTDKLLTEFEDMPLPDLVEDDTTSVPPMRRVDIDEEGEEEKADDDLSNMPGLLPLVQATSTIAPTGPAEAAAAATTDEENVVLRASEDEELEAAMTNAAKNAASAVAASRAAEASRLAATTRRGVAAAINTALYQQGAPLSTLQETNQNTYNSQQQLKQQLQQQLQQIEQQERQQQPLAQGAYSGVAYSQPSSVQIVQNVPLLPLGTTVLGSAAPGGQPTLLVDTSSAAMNQQGLNPLPDTGRQMGMSGPRNRNNTTRRQPRAPVSFSPPQQTGPSSANARVTVQKLG
jgi:hypothetical protein